MAKHDKFFSHHNFYSKKKKTLCVLSTQTITQLPMSTNNNNADLADTSIDYNSAHSLTATGNLSFTPHLYEKSTEYQ